MSQAFAELFYRHAAELCGYLRFRRGAPDNPRAWLYRTAANLAADAYDHRQVRSRLHVDWPDLAEEAASPCPNPAVKPFCSTALTA